MTANTGLLDAEGNEIYTADILMWADGRNDEEYTVLNLMDAYGCFAMFEPFFIARYRRPEDEVLLENELRHEELPKVLTKRNSVKYIIVSTRYGTLNKE